jgi:hypothetical protein
MTAKGEEWGSSATSKVVDVCDTANAMLPASAGAGSVLLIVLVLSVNSRAYRESDESIAKCPTPGTYRSDQIGLSEPRRTRTQNKAAAVGANNHAL